MLYYFRLCNSCMSGSAVFEQAYTQHTSSGLTQVRAGVCEELSWAEAAQIVSTYLRGR